MHLAPNISINGEYTLVRHLGSGTFGHVWLARHVRLNRDVALKFASTNLLQGVADGPERFAREALTHARLNHRHIVPLLDAGTHEGVPYLVLRYLPGGSLDARAGKLSTHRLLRYGADLCAALQHAHDHGVIHRDFKPENLLLDADDEVYVADFGIARTLESVIGPERFRQATHATRAGTPGFMAPEQVRGTAIDHRADLFGLGATLTALVTGEGPIDLIMPQRQALLNRLDPTLRAILDRLTQPRPEDRYPTAREARAAFLAALEPGKVIEARRVPLPSRRAVLVGAAGAAGVAASASALRWFGAAESDPPFSTPSPLSPPPPTPTPPNQHLIPTLITLRAGTFRMGSADGVGHHDEHPERTITLTSPFAVGEAPITQAQWRAVVEAAKVAPWAATEPGVSNLNPSPSFFTEGADAPQRPVEQVTWLDTMAWCNALSRLTGRRPAYRREGEAWTWDRSADGFRLPTEAEWEYACRAGTSTAWSSGDDEAKLADYAWYDANSANTTHPVRQKRPNPWGLYDVHGNVWEWCWDWYADAYDPTDTTDPAGAPRGDNRVDRGGSFWLTADGCRSAYRSGWHPEDRNQDRGLRVVLSPPPSGPGL
jgi:formylglycine-generating enzyme required for sulfatase activity